jgi:hypothetical protein
VRTWALASERFVAELWLLPWGNSDSVSPNCTKKQKASGQRQ